MATTIVVTYPREPFSVYIGPMVTLEVSAKRLSCCCAMNAGNGVFRVLCIIKHVRTCSSLRYRFTRT